MHRSLKVRLDGRAFEFQHFRCCKQPECSSEDVTAEVVAAAAGGRCQPPVFDRLFGAAKCNSTQDLARQERYKKSILDLVCEDAQQLRGKLSGTDQQKLDEYLHAVRDVERRISSELDQNKPHAAHTDYPRPSGAPRDFAQHARLMFDLMALAFQTDMTRIITFMYTNAGSNRSYPQIDVREGHHNLSHHGNDPGKQAKISKINHYHVSLFAHLIKKLHAVTEGDGTLLDNCMVMYGSGIGDGNRHNQPIILLGRGQGAIVPGRHLKYPRNTPLTNLYVSMLDRMQVPVSQFGDSDGKLLDLMR